VLQPSFCRHARCSTWVITPCLRAPGDEDWVREEDCNERFTQMFGKWVDKTDLIGYIIHRNLDKRGKKMGLIEFVNECMKVDSRLTLTNESGVLCAYIGDKSVVLDGYNFPYQAHLITNLMAECGSFK